MFLHAQWHTARQIERTSITESTPHGRLELWLQGKGGTAELALLFQVEQVGIYVTPAALLGIAEKLQTLRGGSPVLHLTPVPANWLTARGTVCFERAGFSVRFLSQTIELSAQIEVGEAFIRVALVACALDPKSGADPELLKNALRLALRCQVDIEALFRAGTASEARADEPHVPAKRCEVDFKWMFYVPPSVATLQAERIDEELEDPKLVFDYYRNERVNKLVAEQDRGGSHAVAVICRDTESAMKRFGSAQLGQIYSATGRQILEVVLVVWTKKQQFLDGGAG